LFLFPSTASETMDIGSQKMSDLASYREREN